MLNKELNKEEMVNLDEPANTIIPYTGLFIAYINDHYQVNLDIMLCVESLSEQCV